MTKEEAAEVMLEGVWLKCERCLGKGFGEVINDPCAACGCAGFIRHPRADEACLILGIPIPEKPMSTNEILERAYNRFKETLNRPSLIRRMVVRTDVDDDKGKSS